MTLPTVALRNVSKHFGHGPTRAQVLSDVYLGIFPKEVMGIMGPSGSGKTTLLSLAGLVELPSSGEVCFENESPVTALTSLATIRTIRSRRIGFVFQKANLVPFLTALENVELALSVQNIPKNEARDRSSIIMTELGVDHRFKHYPNQLSGGEQQRVALARALVTRPSLLLADEPTASLDAKQRDMVMQLLRKLVDRSKIAVCVVSHDQRTEPFFDRLITISDGRITSAR